MTKSKAQPARKSYRLTQPHTHRGRDYAAGESLELTADQAQFIQHKLHPETNTATDPVNED